MKIHFAAGTSVVARDIVAVGATAALLLGSAGVAFAQLSSSHQIPYQGHLDLDGVAVSGPFDFWFELYSTPDGGDCMRTPPPSTDCLWADEVTGVEVTGGAFSVVLGSVANPLGDAIWQNDVYLGIRVMGGGDAGYTALTGRQRILAVPMAARAETAKNYHVTGTLVVDGATTLSGPTTVNAAMTTRGILPRYQPWSEDAETGDGGAAIYNDNETYSRLMIVGNTLAGGTLRRVGILDDLFVGNNLDVNGRLLPDYQSAWKEVSSASANEVTFEHGLGSIPSHVQILQCGAVDGDTCLTRVVMAGTRGYQDGTSLINPVTVTADNTQIYVALTTWWVWGYWTPAKGFDCPGGVNKNCRIGYYRVLAWR